MTTQQNFESKDVVNEICAGIDVHRDKINVTIAKTEGKRLRYYYAVFSTLREDLERMLEWILSHGCKVVGMESTGQLWCPVYDVLEDHVEVYLYNARHIKNIPGKKTDKKDSQWIAKITRHELISHSFIPDRQTRDTRDLVRFRKAKVADRTRTRQQIHDLLNCASMRISSFLTDIFGVSGRILLDCIANERPVTKEFLEKKMHGSLSDKIDSIYKAMQGKLSDGQKYRLRLLLKEEAHYSEWIADIEAQLEKMTLNTPKRKDVFNRLLKIPGISERSAMLLIGEIGIDLTSFPTHKHFSSWCGLVPGNKESAGKNLSGRIKVRQHYLRSLLVEIAFAATRCKNTYYNYKFFSMRSRKVTQKAIIAIARKLSIAVFSVIALGENYKTIDPKQVQENTESRDLRNFQLLAKKIGEDKSRVSLEEIFKQKEP